MTLYSALMIFKESAVPVASPTETMTQRMAPAISASSGLALRGASVKTIEAK